MPFLQDLLDQTEEFEPPRSYWYWSGLAAISAVSKNVYLDLHGYLKVYPNIYVLLVGKSANRKGPPVNLVQSLVEKVGNIRVISGRNTVQAVIKEAATAVSRPDGSVMKDAACFLVSDEQSNLLTDDPQGQTLLTQLYDTDYHEVWQNKTIYGSTTELKNPYFVILGATAQSHTSEYIQERSISGGYIGRTFLIFEENRSRLNSLMTKPLKTLDKDSLLADLKKISALKGTFTMTQEAMAAYDDWYYPFNQKLETRETVDETGFSGRLGAHVLKVAMLISMSYKEELILTKDDIDLSITACTALTSSVKRIGIEPGKNEFSRKALIVILDLVKCEGAESYRSKILQRIRGEVDSFDLDRVERTLVESGNMTVENVPGQGVKYKLTPEAAAHYKGALEKARKNN